MVQLTLRRRRDVGMTAEDIVHAQSADEEVSGLRLPTRAEPNPVTPTPSEPVGAPAYPQGTRSAPPVTATPRNFQGPPPSLTSASAGTPPDEVPALASSSTLCSAPASRKVSGKPLSSCCRSRRWTPLLRSTSAPTTCPGTPEQAAGAPRDPTRGSYSTWRPLSGSTRTFAPRVGFSVFSAAMTCG